MMVLNCSVIREQGSRNLRFLHHAVFAWYTAASLLTRSMLYRVYSSTFLSLSNSLSSFPFSNHRRAFSQLVVLGQFFPPLLLLRLALPWTHSSSVESYVLSLHPYSWLSSTTFSPTGFRGVGFANAFTSLFVWMRKLSLVRKQSATPWVLLHHFANMTMI